MTIEGKSKDETDVVASVDNEDLVSSVDQKLQDTFGDTPAEELEEEEKSTPDKKDQADETDSDDDSTSDGDTEDKDESGDTDGDENKDTPSDADDKKKDDDEDSLPDAYYQAALHDGWKPEGIKEFFEANPKQAMNTFQNIHNSRNRASKEFAAIGRANIENERKRVEAEAKVADEVEVEDFVDIKKLQDNPDIDVSVIDGVIKPLNDALKKISKEMASFKSPSQANVQATETARREQDTATQRANAAADQADLQLIEQFFSAPNMKSYGEFYGDIKDSKNLNDLTFTQRDNRNKVLESAGQQQAGHVAQGLELSVNDALLRGHLLVTESLREKVMIKDITASIEKRKSGKTLRPSSSKKIATGDSSKPSNRAELEEKVHGKMQKIFKD